MALIAVGLVAAGMQMRGVLKKEFTEAAQTMRTELLRANQSDNTFNTETLYVSALRAGPGSSYGTLAKLNANDVVTTLEGSNSNDGGNWVKIKAGNLEGWVNKKNLSTEKYDYPAMSTAGHGEWVKVGTKTCEVGWSNQDFKEGWCKLGIAQPGTYKLNIRSTLQSTSTDNKAVDYPADGLPISRWNNNGENTEFITHFETWSPLKNHQIGMIMLKIDNEAPIDLREITLTKERTIYASINFPFSQDNWETMKFKGNITVEVLKAGRSL